MPWVEDPVTGERTWKGRGNPFFGLVRSPGRPKRTVPDPFELPATAVVEDTVRQHLSTILDNLIARATGQTKAVRCPECGHRVEVKVAGDPDVGRYLVDRLVGKPVERREETRAVLVETLRRLMAARLPPPAEDGDAQS